jgi:hypothetical protein
MGMMNKYILKGHKPVVEKDLLTWGRWFEDGDKRRVALTKVGKWTVSTVFLGLDHSEEAWAFAERMRPINQRDKESHLDSYRGWNESK